MIAYALNSHIYPVRMEVTATKQITTLYICSTDKSELKEFLVDKPLSQICSKDDDKSKGIIVEKRSTEKNEP